MIVDCDVCAGTGIVTSTGRPCPKCFGAGAFQTFYFTTVVKNGALYKSEMCEDINMARTEFEIAQERHPEGRVRFNSQTHNHWRKKANE